MMAAVADSASSRHGREDEDCSRGRVERFTTFQVPLVERQLQDLVQVLGSASPAFGQHKRTGLIGDLTSLERSTYLPRQLRFYYQASRSYQLHVLEKPVNLFPNTL